MNHGRKEGQNLNNFPGSINQDTILKIILLVYEYRPAGLLLGLMPLIVLILRCKPFDDEDDISCSPRDREEGGYDDDEGPASIDLDPFRSYCLGDVGQLDDCIGAKRDLDPDLDALLDFRRNIPGLVSELHNPNLI